MSELKACATCRHWRTDPDEDFSQEGPLGLRQCQNVPMFWDATEWKPDGDGRRFVEKYKDHKIFANDGSSYFAAVYTKPDFGCVSHEQGEP